MYLYIIIGLQIVVIFLISLNEYLLGASKDKIRTFLVVLNLILIIVSFVIGSLLIGGIFIAATIVWAILCAPLAKYIAFKMIGYKVPIRNQDSNDLGDLLTGKTSMDKYFDRSEIDKNLKKEKISKILHNIEIQNILRDFSKTLEDLETYEVVLVDIYIDVISSPKKLRMLLEFEKEGFSHSEISYKMRQIW